jgi:hypothetical protein
MLTVATVLRSGNEFTAHQVEQLQADIDRFLRIEYRHVCLTDDPAHDYMWGNPLEHDWPGWWSKMEIYRLPGPVLYFDLDTVIVGDITPLAEAVVSEPRNSLLMIRDFYRKNQQTGILGWSGDMRWLYEKFKNEWAARARWVPLRHGTAMHAHNQRFGGDAEWLRKMIATGVLMWEYFERHVHGIMSYKVHVVGNTKTSRLESNHVPPEKLPEGARVVCFHGKPRPWELEPQPPWIKTKPDYGAIDEPASLEDMTGGVS